MADTVDEDYRFETLPHAVGKDRRDMVDRKLKQLYRSTPFYGAQLQEREDGKRRDDRYLFAALTNPDCSIPGCASRAQAGCRSPGCFPCRWSASALIKRLRAEGPNLLLVSRHERRRAPDFLQGSAFRISRLTPMRAGESTRIESYAEEIRNTRMYLDALNVTHVDDSSPSSSWTRTAAWQTLGELRRQGPPQHAGRCGSARASIDRQGRGRPRRAGREPGRSAPAPARTAKSPGINLAPPALTSGYSR